MKKLNIFCDESGDFGNYDSHSPYYIICFVLHEDSTDLSSKILHFENTMIQIGFPSHIVHSGPLIRRETPYSHLTIEQRRQIFNRMFHFTRSCPIQYKTFLIEKKHHPSIPSLIASLSKDLTLFFQYHLNFFQQYEKITLYYDNGQHELSKILISIFNSYFTNFEFRKVLPVHYRLFQAADMLCTLRLLKQKLQTGSLSHSEMIFFSNPKNLKKNYLKLLDLKSFK